MVEVAVERWVPAPVSRVTSLLSPATIVDSEGRYTPREVAADGDRTVVTVWPTGRLLAYHFLFESRKNGYVYRLQDDQRPVRVATRLWVTADGDGTLLRLVSRVEPTLPIPLLGRAVARGRRQALESLCDRVEADFD